ncbi:MAG: hypothetical protein ACTSWF_03965 [Candidatus Freyarchaeota archaeon]
MRGFDLKVFENGVRAILVYFELGKPWWFRLIDLGSNRTICKDFVRNRARLRRCKHVEGILAEVEEWLKEWRNNKKHIIPPPPNSVPPM